MRPIRLPLWITVYACGWLFAISGVRRGIGSSRFAAGVALLLLILGAMWLLLAAFY